MEVSLRDQLRQGVDEERLLHIISSAVNKKKKRHAGKHWIFLHTCWVMKKFSGDFCVKMDLSVTQKWSNVFCL